MPSGGRSSIARRLSSTFSASTPRAVRVGRRLNLHNCSICCRGCAAGANRCHDRPVARSAPAGRAWGWGGGGMGWGGPGETKIELDRRRIHTRMARLRKQIAGFAPAREAKRANRRRNEVPSVVIAGYTNAGKSSLLNRITGAGLLVENALFATLDST